MMSVLPSRIKQLRIDKGWTQERLALVAGLSYRTIQRIEKDGRCSLDSKMALSAAFNIALLELSNEGQNTLNRIFELSIVQDLQGIYKSVHGRGLELSFKFWEDIVGKNFADVLPVNISQRVVKAIEKIRMGAELAEFGYQELEADGKRYFSVKMVKNDEASLLSVITEISQQKTKEHKLLKSQTLLTLVADTLKTGAWEMNLATMTPEWTKQLYTIYELDEKATLTETIKFFPLEVRSTVQQAFTGLIESGIPYDLEVPFTTAKGKKLWVRVIGVPLYANAKVVRVSGIVQDITHLKII
jgi:transcriptional regulator with XRE-family HTH domain